MPRARHFHVPPGQPGCYHLIARCVRRAFLCGEDTTTNIDFSHRREWFVQRLKDLANSFAVDVHAYAIMSNHLHIVVHIDPDRVDGWSDDQVIQRWNSIWLWRSNNKLKPIPKNVPDETLKLWRGRLGNVSWFMRALCEPIARRANAEDECTGRFFEGRFKALPLLDDAAAISGLVYADLNPIRAGIAENPEDSDYTSIQQRLCELALQNQDALDKPLQPCMTSDQKSSLKFELSLREYIELVKASAGDALTRKNEKRRQLLKRLGLNEKGWVTAIKGFISMFRTAVGSEENMTKFMQTTGRVRQRDLKSRKALYLTAA